MNSEKISKKIDDGYNAQLVENATFDGIFEIPTITKPDKMIVPLNLVPFSMMKKEKDHSCFVCFYEHDSKFKNFIQHPQLYLKELRQFQGVISPDCSLYYDMPLTLQIMNTYKNRQIGHYLQSQGLYVVPNIRWGDKRSFEKIINNEKPFAFLGVEKHSIVSIGTYGCIHGKQNTCTFKDGLNKMLQIIRPKIVLVYGAMTNKMFGDFKSLAKFYQFNDWITRQHGKTNDGELF